MRQFIRYPLLQGLLFMVLIAVGWQAVAASRVLDRIETRSEGESTVIAVYFNIPVRYVSHVMNESNSEIGVQLQIVQSPELNLEDLLSRDQLSWNPSQETPLSKVVYQGLGPKRGTSSLLVSFATPVMNFRIRQSRDFNVMEFLLKKPSKLAEVELSQAPPIEIDVPETRPSLSFKSLPLVIYVINLSSSAEPVDLEKIAPMPVEGNQALYTTRTPVDGHDWHRLRIGFFRTEKEAKAKLKEIKNFYPKAWIDRADIYERRQALFESGLIPESEMAGEPLAPGVGGVVTGAIAGAERAAEAPAGGLEQELQPVPPEDEQVISPANERLSKMIELIRHAMTAGEYPKAIRMLEGFLAQPENDYTMEAAELLGLARERNGQTAHAKAEYEAFLEKYPEGEDTDRVKQRLLGLITAPKTPKAPLHEQEDERPVEWDTYGSLSQRYVRLSNDSDAGTRVSQSDIDTFINVSSRRRSQELDVQMRFTGSYSADLLTDSEGNDKSLSEAYFDVQHLDSRTTLRMGRQRLAASGILSRFDGLVLGYELTPDIRVRGYAGLPVESSRNVFLHEHKSFMGVSGDISNLIEKWDASLYLIDQKVDGLIDRQAVGGKLTYFDQNKSLYGLVDYDIHYGVLNIFALHGNWTLADETRLYMNLDYRKSPLLLTSNAIRSYYSDPDQFVLVESIEELNKFETEDYIYSRAEGFSADLTTLMFGASRPLSPSLQISADMTITNAQGTPQLGIEDTNDYVEAVEGAGNGYYYNLQLIKNDLLKQGDIGILSMRYQDASTSDTLSLGLSSRYPITNLWRINPRIDLSYRKRTGNGDTRLKVSPLLRMDYKLRKRFTLEFEGGVNWYKEESGMDVSNTTDYLFLAGYRWDF